MPTGSASAQQLGPGINTTLQKEPKQLTPEEQKYQQDLDKNYKAAQKKIPVQKQADPWADMRSAPTSSTSKKSPQ
jgi:hypothetical protein